MFLDFLLRPILDKNTLIGGAVDTYCETKDRQRHSEFLSRIEEVKLRRRETEALERIDSALKEI